MILRNVLSEDSFLYNPFEKHRYFQYLDIIPKNFKLRFMFSGDGLEDSFIDKQLSVINYAILDSLPIEIVFSFVRRINKQEISRFEKKTFS